MAKIAEFQKKEVINIRDGQRLGYTFDMEIDDCDGRIISIIVPGPNKYAFLTPRMNGVIINWSEIDKIGKNCIMVNIDPSAYRQHKRGNKKIFRF